MVDSCRLFSPSKMCWNLPKHQWVRHHGGVYHPKSDITAPEELKGIEYGCTVDAVSLLIPAMQRKRGESMPLVGTAVAEHGFPKVIHGRILLGGT